MKVLVSYEQGFRLQHTDFENIGYVVKMINVDTPEQIKEAVKNLNELPFLVNAENNRMKKMKSRGEHYSYPLRLFETTKHKKIICFLPECGSKKW